MVSSKEAGIFPTAWIASPAASLAWPYKSCTLSSACCVWPCGFLAVPLKRFSSIVMVNCPSYQSLTPKGRVESMEKRLQVTLGAVRTVQPA